MKKVAAGQPLAEGMYVRTRTPGSEASWGRILRIQDGMVMVCMERENRTCWFQKSDIREYYQRVRGGEDCLQVDAEGNVAIHGVQLDMHSRRAVLRSQKISLTAGDSSIDVQSTCVNVATPACMVEGVLHAREVMVGQTALCETVRRLEQEVRELRRLLTHRHVINESIEAPRCDPAAVPGPPPEPPCPAPSGAS